MDENTTYLERPPSFCFLGWLPKNRSAQCLFESCLEVRIRTLIKISGWTNRCWVRWGGNSHLLWKPTWKSSGSPGQTSKTIAVSNWKATKPGIDSDKSCMTWLLLQLICFSRSWQAACGVSPPKKLKRLPPERVDQITTCTYQRQGKHISTMLGLPSLKLPHHYLKFDCGLTI